MVTRIQKLAEILDRLGWQPKIVTNENYTRIYCKVKPADAFAESFSRGGKVVFEYKRWDFSTPEYRKDLPINFGTRLRVWHPNHSLRKHVRWQLIKEFQNYCDKYKIFTDYI